MNKFNKRERYYFIRAIVFMLLAMSLIMLSGCDNTKCGIRTKINIKTGEKYIGFACDGDW